MSAPSPRALANGVLAAADGDTGLAVALLHAAAAVLSPERDLAAVAQAVAERRLAEANEDLYAEEDGEQPFHNSTAGPYDGCDTCVVREVLDAAYDELLAMARLEVQRESRG